MNFSYHWQPYYPMAWQGISERYWPSSPFICRWHKQMNMVSPWTNRDTLERNVPLMRLDNDADLWVWRASIHDSTKVYMLVVLWGHHWRNHTYSFMATTVAHSFYTRRATNFTLLLCSPSPLGNFTAPFAKSEAASAQPCMHTDNDQVN